MTFAPINESSIVHPNISRDAMPADLLSELDAFEASLQDPEAEISFDIFIDEPAPAPTEDEDELEELSLDDLELIDEPAAACWPRSFEDHVAEVRAAADDPVARRALSLMGLGDIYGFEEVVAATTKTAEALRFWQPMMDMERDGFFTAHHRELRACLALLQAHPAPEHHPALLQRWEAARDELLELLPTWATQEFQAAC